MNVSALRQIAAHWKEIRGALALLREGAIRRSAAGPLSRWELRWAATAGVILPGYMLCQGGGMPESGRLDPVLSGTSKILFDVITVVDRLAEEALQQGALEEFLEAPVDVDGFIRFAEESGAFVGPRGACAAPDGLVREALTILVGPDSDARGSTEEMKLALGDTDAFFRFVDAFFAMDIACCSYQFAASELAQSLVEAMKELPGEVLGSQGKRVIRALELAIQALPDLDFVILPRERRRRVIELHSHYLRRLGLSPPVSSAPAATTHLFFLDANTLSPELKQLIEPVHVAAVHLEHLAARGLLGLGRDVMSALRWKGDRVPEQQVLLERLLGIGVARVLRQACETSI